MFKSVAKATTGIVTAGLLAIAGASAASAASVNYVVQNLSGQTITLDTASCTDGAFISPSYSIPNGYQASFSGTNSGPTTLCNVRYQKSNGGCQFQVQVSDFGGFASTNAYKGSASCSKIDERRTGSNPNSYLGIFRIQ